MNDVTETVDLDTLTQLHQDNAALRGELQGLYQDLEALALESDARAAERDELAEHRRVLWELLKRSTRQHRSNVDLHARLITVLDNVGHVAFAAHTRLDALEPSP